MVCIGTHDAEIAENNRIREQIENAAQKANIGNFRIHIQDYQQDRFIKAGQTLRGTKVLFKDE